jgi:hypothetical protein
MSYFKNDADGQWSLHQAEWNLATPKPTLEQLNAFEAQATTYENNQKIIANKKIFIWSVGQAA